MKTLDAEQMIASAKAQTGLDDFGPDDFLEPFRVLIDSINREARLTDDAAVYQERILTHYLRQHLRFEEYLRRHPEIEEQEVVAPLVVLGLQRSGTTKLSRVIASDPQWHVIRQWDGMSPVPLSDELSAEEDKRQRLAIAQEHVTWSSRVNMNAAHYVDVDQPEQESVTLWSQTFMTPPAWLHTPSHHRWCETADHIPLYRFFKRQLKFMQWIRGERPGKRWVLKTPAHLDHLDELTAVFPDACIAWSHRHPGTAVSSLFRIVEMACSIYSDDVDREAIGRLWLHNQIRMIGRALDFRDRNPQFPLHDVQFKDTVGDSVGVVKAIYEFAGAPFTQATEQAIANWEEENEQGKHGEYKYALADYGVTVEEIEEGFRDYIDRFIR